MKISMVLCLLVLWGCVIYSTLKDLHDRGVEAGFRSGLLAAPKAKVVIIPFCPEIPPAEGRKAGKDHILWRI